MTQVAPDAQSRPATRGLLLLLAAAAGICVANLYYAQPLAAAMAQSLGVAPAAIGGALMATQVGYALGMTLLVPLGDGRERRGVILTTLLCSRPLPRCCCSPARETSRCSRLAACWSASPRPCRR